MPTRPISVMITVSVLLMPTRTKPSSRSTSFIPSASFSVTRRCVSSVPTWGGRSTSWRIPQPYTTKVAISRPLAVSSSSCTISARELFFLYHIREFIAEEPREPLLKDVWLGNLQIMTARRNNLYVAMKGGHNNESHNHNDVGSFIVYADNEPLLIDPGVGEYTSKTFSDERYTIWTMQSSYHNLPQINGTDQKDGREYAAKVVNHQDGSLTLDIAGAYPPEADIKSWKRTVNTMESGISVTENYVLKAYHQPARLMFMTIIKPEVQNGAIVLGRHRLNYNPAQLEATVEDISNQLDPLLQRMWGNQMYRIILSVKSKKNKETIKYSIQ